jgi:hypothetical protein
VVWRTCNPSSGKLRQEDLGFKASLGYIVKPCLQKKKRKRKIVIWKFGLVAQR